MEETRQSYLASQITNEMFSELLDYMYLATHGSSLEYMITLENVAYFMKSPEKTDILLNGDDEQKWTITKSDYRAVLCRAAPQTAFAYGAALRICQAEWTAAM